MGTGRLLLGQIHSSLQDLMVLSYTGSLNNVIFPSDTAFSPNFSLYQLWL